MLKTTVTVKESKSAINAFMYCELYLMYFAMISCPKETTSWSLVKSYVVQEDKSSKTLKLGSKVDSIQNG